MAYNSDGYIMIDFTEVDFRRTNQTIDGLYKRCVDVIGTNKFILVINANGRTPLPATCSFTNNQYVIDTCIYMFAISSNDNLFIRRNDVPASDIIDDDSISVDKTWSSNKINTELDGKQDTLTAGTNITIDENNVISSTGGAVIDDNVIVNNKVWSSLNTVEMLAPIDTVVGNPATFNTSLALPLVACTAEFMCTQEGSGDPSPSNVRPIHGFSEVNVTANNVVYTIQFGQEVYGAEVDVVNGVAHVTHVKEVLRGSYFDAYIASIQSAKGGKPVGWLPWLTQTGGSCEMLSHGLPTTRSNIGNVSNGCFIGDTTGGNQGAIFVKFTGYSSLEGVQAFIEEQYNLNNPVEVVYKLAEPFDIQLTPTQIETLIGNNSFASDTGSIKVSYKCLPSDLL